MSPGRNAIVVQKLHQENKTTVGHVSEILAKLLAPMLKNRTVISVEADVIGKSVSATEGTWVFGGGIEIPCRFHLYALKKDKRRICQKLKNL